MGQINWERIEKWDYIAAHVADEYHKKYSMVERDDIKQSLYEWFVSHPRKLTEWEKLGNRSAQNLLYRSLRNQALDYCQLWKSKSVGYELSDLYYYDAAVIEALLPAILRGDLTEGPKLDLGMPGRPSAPSEGGNMMAMMAEIKDAYAKLSTEDKGILYLKHANSLDYSSIANELQLTSDDAARMRHKRAIKKIINRLGGYRPFLDKEDEADNRREDGDNEEYGKAKEDNATEQG